MDINIKDDMNFDAHHQQQHKHNKTYYYTNVNTT